MLFCSFVLLLFTFTSVYTSYCSNHEQLCNQYSYSWCCPNDHYCSNISIRCSLYGTTQELYRTHSYMPSGITIVLIVTSIVAFLICVVCCTVLYKQQQRHVRSTIVASHRSSAIHPYQQNPSDIVHIRPAYNINRAPISLPIPSQHEEQPPSYEFATANDPFKYQYESSSFPVSSVTTNIALESTRF